ncbi:uncharacterized protein LOC135708537 [Ochlerotatus camptorhynchus]|uniref:uncharacterized protein LOC135708537 n=1 Tax=Ochlerotatus camptorhynchus TaxID=644619 RepID=UPI0031CF2779
MNRPGLRTVLLPLLLLVHPPPAISQNLFGLAPNIGNVGKKKLVVHRVGQCLGKKDLPIFAPDMRIAPYNATNNAVSGIIEFREDFLNGWDVSASVKKCDDFRASDSCRPFLNNLANSNQCMMLGLSDMMWMKYLTNMSPKAECPFRKGIYTYGETLVDDNLVKYMPGSGHSHWEVEITGKVKNRQVLCIIMQLHVRPKKN